MILVLANDTQSPPVLTPPSRNWPTIPQLYVDGEFIGGCDIITSMHDSGELKEILSDAVEVK